MAAAAKRRIDALARRDPRLGRAWALVLGSVPGKRKRRRRGPTAPSIALSGATSLADLVSALDIGVSDVSAEPSLGYDIARRDIAGLLDAIAAFAAARGRRAFLQHQGAVEPLTRGSATPHVARAPWAPHLRVALVGPDGRCEENLLIRVWRRPTDAWVGMSPLAPVRRMVPRETRTDRTRGLRLDTTVSADIDAVFTWVNGNDPAWRKLVAPYRQLEDSDIDRFVQVDELRFALRAVDLFAPWFRRVIVFTNCAPPPWFKGTDRVVWMDHSAAIPADKLPLFNSHAIEAHLHRIPDLTERFVYFNDDFLLWDSVLPRTFFTHDGRSIAHFQELSSVPKLVEEAAAGLTREWSSAAANGTRMLQERFGFTPTFLHQHAPYALLRSVMTELETVFPDEMERTRSSRFRAHTDVSWVSFFYHHYAIATGRGVSEHSEHVILNEVNHRSRASRARLAPATFVCVNDGSGSGLNADFQRFKGEFLERQLPIRSSAEA